MCDTLDGVFDWTWINSMMKFKNLICILAILVYFLGFMYLRYFSFLSYRPSHASGEICRDTKKISDGLY